MTKVFCELPNIPKIITKEILKRIKKFQSYQLHSYRPFPTGSVFGERSKQSRIKEKRQQNQGSQCDWSPYSPCGATWKQLMESVCHCFPTAPTPPSAMLSGNSGLGRKQIRKSALRKGDNSIPDYAIEYNPLFQSA